MSIGATLVEAVYRPPFTALMLLGVLAVVLVLLALSTKLERAWWTALLRVLGVLGLVWVLLGYSLISPGRPSNAQHPTLRVLIDTSTSMAERDAIPIDNSQAATRLDVLRESWLSDERLELLRRIADVELVAFDQQTRPTRVDALLADGGATRLFQSLAQGRADATLILSDGNDTTSRGVTDADPSRNAGRLFAVPVGSPRSAPDIALQAWAESDRLFEDQATTLTVSISQRGMAGRAARVELTHNGEPIASESIILDPQGNTLRFEIKPALDAGRVSEAHHYTARVVLAEGEEAYSDNNIEDVFVQVSRGRVRVLLLEGEPYWDTRSLARLIGAHPRFDLTAVYGFGERRQSRIFGEAVSPGTDPAQDLSAYDIVVLGRRVERLVDGDFAQRLDTFVRGGGSAVFARGRPFDPRQETGQRLLATIETISPVAWAEPVVGEIRVRLGTADDPRGPLAGLDGDAVLSELPGMLAATRVAGRKAASVVLLEQASPGEATPMAAMTSLKVGSGTVLAVLTEGLWRWELLPGVDESDASVESAFGVLWVRALQWLASGGAFLPGQDIALEADRLGVEPGETVRLTVSTRYVETDGLDLLLSAIDVDGNATPITLEADEAAGRYTASFTPGATGVYTFALQAPGRDDLIEPQNPLTTRVSVVERSVEKRDTSARPEVLKRITEATGGQCLELDETGPLIDYLQSLQALRSAQPRVDYAFNTWPAFLWIAGCFGLEWILRRRTGLR